MQWNSLGVIQPNKEWQIYNVPTIGVETFRVTSVVNVRSLYGMRAYLGQFFYNLDQVLISKRIYPQVDNKQIVELPIPEDFKAQGNITRYLGIKLGNSRKLGVVAYNWTVEIEEFL